MVTRLAKTDKHVGLLSTIQILAETARQQHWHK